jgi:hypothetical protein
MNEDRLSRNEAAAEFLRQFIYCSYDGAIEVATSLLSNGPPGLQPDRSLLALHEWYKTLDSQSQEHLLTLVRKTAHSAAFGTLCMFDGVSIAVTIADQPVDFAFFLQGYADLDAMWADRPEYSVRINPLDKRGEELHHLFNQLLAEREEQEKQQ